MRSLMKPEKIAPNESSSGAVAAANFDVDDGRFGLGGAYAGSRRSRGGVRGGVRINEA